MAQSLNRLDSWRPGPQEGAISEATACHRGLDAVKPCSGSVMLAVTAAVSESGRHNVLIGGHWSTISQQGNFVPRNEEWNNHQLSRGLFFLSDGTERVTKSLTSTHPTHPTPYAQQNHGSPEDLAIFTNFTHLPLLEPFHLLADPMTYTEGH